MGKKFWALGLVGIRGLSACGYTDFQRAGTGAAAGALAAAATDNDIATGALVGGAGGALCDDVAPELCPR